MKKYNPNNERIKRKYFRFLKEAKQQSIASVDAVAKALNRFEVYNNYRDFKTFQLEQAIAFKKNLANQKGQQSGKPLSKATLHSTLTQLKRFFQWLSRETGYKSRIQYSDAEYFNLSENETRIATARRQQRTPSIEQIKHVIAKMPQETEIEKRNRALIAFTLLTAARISAIASIKLKHIDLGSDCVYQDARDVKTKFSKTFDTFFFPIGEEIRDIVAEWVSYLRDEKLWGNDDPLFPATCVEIGPSRKFEAVGLKRDHWNTTSPIRKIFRDAFKDAGIPYFNPHSFRNTLAQLGGRICKTQEQAKAWSQNFGHENPQITFTCYGEVPFYRQGEIIRALAKPQKEINTEVEELAEAIFKKFNSDK